MTTLFFGTSAFAVPSFELVADRTSLLGAVTQPDRPAGRGRHLRQTPVKAAALERGVRIYEPTRLREFAAEIRDLEIDCFIVASYGKIIPAQLLDLPKLGSLNVHPSLLPRYRGATPIQAALLNGDGETGITIMLMDEGMDTGDIVVQQSVEIHDADDYGSLHDRLARAGAALVGEALLEAQQRGAFAHRVQQGEASVTRPIAKTDLELDWSWPAAKIVNHVRAYSPQPAARARLHGQSIKILKAHVGANGSVVIDELIAPNHGRETGEAYERRMSSG